MTERSESSARAPRRSRLSRRLGVASLAGAIAALVASVAFATFQTTNGSGYGSATTGAVTLHQTASTTCNYLHLVPGDLTGMAGGTCSFSVTYTGTIPAYVSLTVAVQSKAKSGTPPCSTTQPYCLYDGTNVRTPPGSPPAGLTFTISDGHNPFTVPAGGGTTTGCSPGSTCWTASNELAAWYSPAANTTFANGDAVTWTVTPNFPKTVGNGSPGGSNAFQGGTATLTLTAQAVQATPNNTLSCATTPTVGQPCKPSGSFSWS